MRIDSKLDRFDGNNPQNQDGRGKNDFFANRGGHTYSGGRSNYGGAPHFNNNNNNYNNFGNRGNNMNGDRPNFNRNGRPPHYSNYGGYRDQRGPRYFYNNNNNNNNRRDDRNNYYNRGFYTERRYGNNPNFDREDFQENNDYDNEEREAKLEKERILSEFKKKYGKIIEGFKILFVNESLKEEQIIDIIQSIKSSPNLTIFEAMNSIYRQVQIIKTSSLSQLNRQYGPNQDMVEFEYDKNLNKGNLKEVIQKYKIYHTMDDIPDKEKDENEVDINLSNNKNKGETFNIEEKEKKNAFDKYWFYIDDFDKRRKLIKDEEGFFNYLPLMNPDGNKNTRDEDDIYAKNENEILYHALFYKTLMCKECPKSKNNNNTKDNLQLLCPYAHDILKDFRIIYKYTDEDICKFMILLQDSNLFSFQNYLNYIPMSLSPKFNLDSFKVHQCQLDQDCPNDYHICPYYHKSEKVDDMRRPPLLFGYTGSAGDVCFNPKKREYCPEKCPAGIFCRFVHSKNEFNYHPEHFRKEFDCKRKKGKNNKCIFIKTCYGKHPEDEYKENDEEEKEEEVEEEEIEKDEEVLEGEEKVNEILNVAKNFRCRKCQSVESNICYLTQCKHFLCLKCYKRIFNENKKEGKKLVCPFCEKEIIKGSLVRVEF